jgi:predicted AAA+ superfamily ATPase
MWIERRHQEALARLARQFKAVLVTGPRQSGKTSLLTRLFPRVRYVSLDDPLLAANALANPESFLTQLGTPVIVDEVQYAPVLFRYLKRAVDRSNRKAQYLLTGSQSFPLMQGVSESLAGRTGVLELPTLSADEVLSARPSQDVQDYVIRGGFPVLNAGGAEEAGSWFPSYVATYLERDVRNALRIASLRDYARFLRLVATRTATILSYSDIARDVGISPNTAKAWLSVLQASGLVFLLEPYFRNVGKRLVKSPKLYLLDCGLACHLLGIRSWADLERSPLAGNVWETYAFGQLYRSLLHAGETNPSLWFWRTADGNEVDFVVERGGRFLLYEAKLSQTVAEADLRGVHAFQQSYGASNLIKAMIVCRTRKPFPLGPKIVASNGLGLSERDM